MARIAIFCDGTWNSPTMKQPTHVVRLFQKTRRTNAQHTHYFEGVGTGVDEAGFFGKSLLKQSLMKVGGGAFSWGLNDNIKQAYAALCAEYEAGDEIFIFGFSRGAYTARSLAGMIRKCGIVADPTPANLDKAFTLYRKPGVENHPDEMKTEKGWPLDVSGCATKQTVEVLGEWTACCAFAKPFMSLPRAN